ncbi:MAG: 4Fe-4S dicluster domain-containing protein [Dehalococcoidia bacterium]|nr:4Fe-4S dicluster domain-containing protein [Dehalococcoidia bacterium]
MFPTQGTLFNVIPGSLLLAAAVLFSIVVFVRAIWIKVIAPVRRGRPLYRFDRWPERIGRFLVYVIAQRKVFENSYSGVLHALIFWGFIIWQPFTLNLVLEGLSETFTLNTLLGPIWKAYIFVAELATVGVLIGVGMALYRRAVLRPAFLHTARDAYLILAMIGGLMLTYFLSEAFRLSGEGITDAFYAPVSLWLSGWVTASGVSHDTANNVFGGLWLFHVSIFLGFLMYIPYSKHLHLLAAPFNILFQNLEPRGALQPIRDIEQQEHFGAGRLEDLSWKQVLDFDTCTECGRCTEACPAYATDKPLSPRDLILDMKAFAHGEPPMHQREALHGRVEFAALDGNIPLVAGIVHEETLWACVTCGACMEACPVFIEHVPTIIDMRRFLVMEQSKMPEAAEAALVSMERRGHPWRGTQHNRVDWMNGLDLKEFDDGDQVEYLYWVGCSGALEDRNRNVTAAMIKILKAAKVNFGVLGPLESCTGDPARRLGNEYLYQTMAQQNIDLFNTRKVRKVITQCPHCFNTIKNEYPQFGGKYEVVHHTELIAGLLREGRLKLKNTFEGETITYHDSCYLGRHNGVYDAPREIANALPGANVVEMSRNRENSFCCGAGGGHMWMEEKTAKRINWTRTEMALDAGATTVGTACPFCVIMFEDGIRGRNAEEKLKVQDLVEMVAQAIDD